MRRIIWITTTLLALAAASIAVAHEKDGKSVKQVSATFAATTASDVRTATCTASDGTYASSRGRYSGTATSTDPSLNGTATVDAESIVNTTTGFGTVSGKLRIETADGKHTVASFDAVSSSGHIAGLAEGRGSESWNKLIANLSADYTAAGGFANGKLGGTSGGDAVVVSSGGCHGSSTKPETIEGHGAITAVSSTSIPAAGVTCAVPAELATVAGALHVGDRVELKCTSAGGTTTLARVGGGKSGEHSARHK
jgi:hypothetical protein